MPQIRMRPPNEESTFGFFRQVLSTRFLSLSPARCQAANRILDFACALLVPAVGLQLGIIDHLADKLLSEPLMSLPLPRSDRYPSLVLQLAAARSAGGIKERNWPRTLMGSRL